MFIRQINFLIAVAPASIPQPSAVLPIGIRWSEIMYKQLYVNVTLPWMGGDANTHAHIHPNGRCFARFPETAAAEMTSGSVHEIFMPSHIDGTLVRSDCDTYMQPSPSSDMSVSLGIGPGSALVRNTGSVDVVWGNSDSANTPMALVLNSSLEWFNSVACEADSVISIPARLAQHTVSVSAAIGDRNITIEDEYIIAEPDFPHHVAQIPPDMYIPIVNVLRRFGVSIGRRLRPATSFQNCEEIRRNLPPIDLVFSSSVKLTLYSDNYIRMIDSDRCEILVSTRDEGFMGYTDAPLRINPLLLKGTNVRITNDQISFCKSAITGNHFDF